MRENAIASVTSAPAFALLSHGFDGTTCRRDRHVKRSAAELPAVEW
jgi:hypothetical protein